MLKNIWHVHKIERHNVLYKYIPKGKNTFPFIHWMNMNNVVRISNIYLVKHLVSLRHFRKLATNDKTYIVTITRFVGGRAM